MNRGILILALGHPNYGKMAAALASTIKANNIDLKIHLAFADDALKFLSANEMKLFDSKKAISKKYYTISGEKKYIRAKTFLYEISPFEETVFIDADILLLNNRIETLFNEIKEDITFSNFGEQQNGDAMWANVDEVKNVYSLPDARFIKIHSELIYFKKTPLAEAWFKTAQVEIDNIRVPFQAFAGFVPDELPFAISSMINNVMPHQEPYKPICWLNYDAGHKHIYELSKKFIGISMAGAVSKSNAVEIYNLIVSAAYKKLGFSNPYRWINKRNFLKERKTI
jgi:hypothetical protein